MDFSKLTVSQLRALCKDSNLTGYSKLNKKSLIEKLSASHVASPPAAQAVPVSAKLVKRANVQNSPDIFHQHVSATLPQATTSGWSSGMGTPPARTSTSAYTQPSIAKTPTAKTQSRKRRLESVDNSDATPQKRKIHPVADGPPPTVSNPNISQSAAISPTRDAASSFKVPPIPIRAQLPNAFASEHAEFRRTTPSPPAALPAPNGVLASSSRCTVPASAVPQSKGSSGNRFKPLKVEKPPTQTFPKSSIPAATTCVVSEGSDTANATSAHLDFNEPLGSPALQPITIPPTIAQRKFVGHWAIILSALSDDERRACAQASRMLRYAVYLSAREILRQEYSGKRFKEQQVLEPMLTLNWWPYLRARQQERAERLRAYAGTFLARFYPKPPVSPHLWASPDSHKQIAIVLRFLQTRLWFALSIGTFAGRADVLAWIHAPIVEASELVPDEIWLIRTLDGQVFYVLEATCEVIGHPPAAGGERTNPELIRVDWANYVAERAGSMARGTPLLSRMRWANEAEYDHGISRHWLSRTKPLGALGMQLRKVAERYTLACVVASSVSGKWQSSVHMAQDAAGFADVGPEIIKCDQKQSLNLFLPSNHHVESVHLTTSGGKRLHPAIAVIQTAAREYYILRDNGMQIGCEEDGVVERWRALLCCDADGQEMARG